MKNYNDQMVSLRFVMLKGRLHISFLMTSRVYNTNNTTTFRILTTIYSAPSHSGEIQQLNKGAYCMLVITILTGYEEAYGS